MNLGILKEISEQNLQKSFRPKCGAKCRDGHQCCAPAVWDKRHNRPLNGRCRIHGGLSRGPITVEGKLRALRNLKQFKDKRSKSIEELY